MNKLAHNQQLHAAIHPEIDSGIIYIQLDVTWKESSGVVPGEEKKRKEVKEEKRKKRKETGINAVTWKLALGGIDKYLTG